MAFGRVLTAGIGTTATTVSATVPAGKTHTVHGLSLANVTASSVSVTVTISDGTTTISIVKSISIPAGDTLSVMGMEFKHNLAPGDSVQVVSDTASSVDSMYSYLEQ